MGRVLLAIPEGSSGDQLRSLGDWLSRESELRGQIRLMETRPVAGTLGGGLVTALTVGVSSGGAVTVLVSGIISWLRQLAGKRRQPVPAEVKVEFPDGGSIKIATAVVQAWTPAELADEIDRLAGLMSARMLSGGGGAVGELRTGPASAAVE